MHATVGYNCSVLCFTVVTKRKSPQFQLVNLLHFFDQFCTDVFSGGRWQVSVEPGRVVGVAADMTKRLKDGMDYTNLD